MDYTDKHLVVVVDDREEELTKVSDTFEQEGYDVNVATNYEQLAFCLDEDLPELVVINFTDNIEDKHELFLRLRGDERYLSVPVLGIFDSMTLELIDRYLELGIESICTYPYTDKELLLRAEHLVELNANRDELEKKELAIGTMYDEVKNLKLDIKKKMEEIENLKETINRVAILDSLTGLFNRSYALEQLEMAVSRYNRNEISSSIILCNIDDFKEINAEYSHQVGDMVLKEVAIALSKNKRTQDVFSRYTGDTFMIVLPDTDIDGAKFFAERARKIIEAGRFTSSDVEITITFGVATYNQVMSIDMIMKMVEDALKFGKQSGKNKVLVANELLNLM